MRHEVSRRLKAGLTALLTTATMLTLSQGAAAFAQAGTSGSQAPAQAEQPAKTSGPLSKDKIQFAKHIPVSYDNKYELYGGVSFMNGQAGQNLPKRYNMVGLEGQATYWLTDHIGPAIDFRGEFGTTPVFPNPYDINRPYVRNLMGMGGVQYRGYKNQHYAIQYHGLVGVTAGNFNRGTLGGSNSPSHDPVQNALNVGLYSNRVKPIGAFGGSIDINGSHRWAVRLQPDLIVEHYGSEYRQFFSISGGVVWRFGHRLK